MKAKRYARTNASALRKLLPYGSIQEIARRAKVHRITAGQVIDAFEANPGHVVIRTALAYVKEIGSADTQRELHALLGTTPTPQAAALAPTPAP